MNFQKDVFKDLREQTRRIFQPSFLLTISDVQQATSGASINNPVYANLQRKDN
jgi:hypothetical protein